LETSGKIILKGLPVDELEDLMERHGYPRFRGRQLFRWIYRDRVTDFSVMTDLSKAFRAELADKFVIPKLKALTRQESADGTIKYVVGLPDGEKVESVFIPTEDRNTLCVSSQVGCKMACAFCATGWMKFTRHLKAWEIVDQLVALDFPEPVSNIVMMGMGEPFDNWDEVVRALKIFQDPLGPQIGKRHITVSTVGLANKLQEFVDLNLGKLAISLHGTTDVQRGKIMPINRKYPIATLLDTCRKIRFKGQTRITWEYILIDGINDTDEDAHRLAKLLRGIPSKINLLAYNENPFVPFKRPPEERVLRFQNILLNEGYTTTYRRSRGRDIAAACGQLVTEVEKRVAARAARAAGATPALAPAATAHAAP
jgi:23S rRNA (adenine2503-C2)-methyltransferase